MEAIFKSQNPFTGELYETFAFDTQDELDVKIVAGQNAFLHWQQFSFEQRAVCFKKLAALLREGARQYAKIISEEMGKPITQALAEVNKSAWLCEYYAEYAASFLQTETISDNGLEQGTVQYEALGLILQIMPWNFPFWQVFRCTVPTLMAGNVSLLKHAPNVPRSAKAIAALFLEAGFPTAVFQNVFASTEAVAYLMESPLVKGVAITGSVRAGAAVAALAGKNIKPAVLELGGSDAFIVLEGADLAAAAKVGAASRFGNNGQTCIAAKRFIVQETVAERFLELLKAEIANMQQGDPMEEKNQLSLMARADLADELQAQVTKTVTMGAKLEYAGGQQAPGELIFKPIILSHIPKGSPAYEEELFGPVLSFFSVASETEAIALANDTVFGLGASIWTSNIEKAKLIATQLEVGAVAINKLLSSTPFMPFGGIKKSGIGRELGREGIRAFVNIKAVSY